ncbi:hypothetical protein GWI33_014163 [Rhynchophorus ferrugineus]|uniref:Uncharacterized protein n=1 Tax=Rhynchophorus ferrugineus TaxID=354439 RepID=A0A834IFM7_RHYFE|nr:hypothetical protein GWI33_014163 [Rhynchophorus ferrugineus]
MTETPVQTVNFNISDLEVFQVREVDRDLSTFSEPTYQEFLTDVWVGIVLTLMVVSCVCFMCSCLVYHKIQEWKERTLRTHIATNLEAGSIEVDLPSYTIVSGLPSYEEALEQLKKIKEMRPGPKQQEEASKPSPEPAAGSSLSVFNLFGIYNKTGDVVGLKPT